MGDPDKNLEIARSYLGALERGDAEAAISKFFAPDVVLGEFPNLLTPRGHKRDLAAALEGAERGKKRMSRQIYKIIEELADDDRVALEVEWVGTLAVRLGSIPAGHMKAFFAVFLEFRRGRLYGSGITIVSRPGSERAEGKYDGTVLQFIFVVPFCHCPG